MKIGNIVSVMFFIASMTYAIDKKLAFIDANFDDFAKRISKNEQERNMFKIYFSNLVQKIQEAHEKDPQKEKATYRYLYALALNKLEEKHSEWYKEIQPFVADARFTLDEQLDEVRRIIKFFLTRYGAYEEFLNFKVAQLPGSSSEIITQSDTKKGTWENIKEYATSAKNKIAGWFGFGSSSEQHTA